MSHASDVHRQMRRALVAVVTQWGIDRGVDVRELAFRLRTASVEKDYAASDEMIADVTRVVREADEAFQSGGRNPGKGSRHWVHEQFLPRLEEAGLVIVRATPKLESET